MKIIIIGCGKVGFAITEQLVRENHDITVIDSDDDALSRISEELDVMVLGGNGASFGTLREAGAENADLIIAVTSTDEVNMLCCQTAKALGTAFSICRIRDTDYTREVDLLKAKLGIDVVINPEYSTAREISRLLRFPSAVNVETFYRGRVEMLSLRLKKEDFIVGIRLSELSSRVRSLPFLFCACQRGKEIIIPNGSFVPKEGDRLYVIGEYRGLAQLFKLLGRKTNPVRHVFLVGGGRISYYLLKSLPASMRVKLVELNPVRCRELSADFPDALIIHGDGTDQELLQSENLTSSDAFIALGSRDEDNLITAMYAMLQGVRLVVAKSSHENCASIAEQVGLDTLVSPKKITADRIVGIVRSMAPSQGSVISALYHIADGQVEALEFEVTSSTRNLGIPLKELRLKPGVLLTTIVHNGQIRFPEGSSVISEGDTVILVSQNASVRGLNDIFADNRKGAEVNA